LEARRPTTYLFPGRDEEHPIDPTVLHAACRLHGMRNRLMAIVGLAQIRAYRFSVAHRAVARRDEK
jgi:hypothetical protein